MTVVGFVAAAIAGVLAAPMASAGASGTDRDRPAAVARADRPRVIERELRRCTNRQRLRRGLPALRPDPDLARAARDHAAAMARGGFFGHVDPQGRGPAERVARYTERYGAGVGENIARRSPTAAATCRLWMTGGDHRANILDPDFVSIGTGYAARRKHGRFYVQVFGVPAQTGAGDGSPPPGRERHRRPG